MTISSYRLEKSQDIAPNIAKKVKSNGELHHFCFTGTAMTSSEALNLSMNKLNSSNS